MNHPTAQPTTRGDFYRLMSTIANHRPELYSLASEAERCYVAYPALLAALKLAAIMHPYNVTFSQAIAQAESEG